MLWIWRTESEVGGPAAQEFPLDQLFHTQNPALEGTLVVIVATRTESMKNEEEVADQSTRYSWNLVVASDGAAY